MTGVRFPVSEVLVIRMMTPYVIPIVLLPVVIIHGEMPSQRFFSFVRDSIVVSISPCHGDDRGSIPRLGIYYSASTLPRNSCA